jgi:hypothetical protein
LHCRRNRTLLIWPDWKETGAVPASHCRFCAAAKRAEDILIGMGGKEALDPGVILRDPGLERGEQAGAGDGEQALGARVVAAPATNSRALAKNSRRRAQISGRTSLWRWRNFSQRGRPAVARACGVGKARTKAQAGVGPVLEGLKGTRAVLAEGALERIEEGGAFFDQRHFIAAEQPQLGDKRILRRERPPGVPIRAQGIRGTPGIGPVGLGPARLFALAVRFGADWGDGENRDPAGQQMLDDDALAGFHTDREGGAAKGAMWVRHSCQPAAEWAKLEAGHDLAATIDDDDVVVIPWPSQSRRSGCRRPRPGVGPAQESPPPERRQVRGSDRGWVSSWDGMGRRAAAGQGSSRYRNPRGMKFSQTSHPAHEHQPVFFAEPSKDERGRTVLASALCAPGEVPPEETY